MKFVNFYLVAVAVVVELVAAELVVVVVVAVELVAVAAAADSITVFALQFVTASLAVVSHFPLVVYFAEAYFAAAAAGECSVSACFVVVVAANLINNVH